MSVCCNPFGPTMDFLLFLHWRISMRSEFNHLLLVYFYKWVVLLLKSHCGTFQTEFLYFKSAKKNTRWKHATKRNQTLNVKQDHATFAKMHLEDDLKKHWICLPTVEKQKAPIDQLDTHSHTQMSFNRQSNLDLDEEKALKSILIFFLHLTYPRTSWSTPTEVANPIIQITSHFRWYFILFIFSVIMIKKKLH